MLRRVVGVVLAWTLILALSAGAMASTPGRLLIWADETRADAIEDIAAQFSSEFGIAVEIQELGFGDIRDNLAIAGPGGTGPDIIVGAHDWLGELVANGLIEPLQLDDVRNQFEPVAVEAFTWGDEVYGLPYVLEAIGLFYNKALVATPPSTWDELVAAGRKVAAQDGMYGLLIPIPDPYHTFPLLSGPGGYVFGQNDDGTLNPLDIGLNSPGAVRGMALFAELIRERILPVVDYNTMASLFNEGRAAMMVTGPWQFTSVREAGIDYGFTGLPAIDGQPARPFVGVQAFMVSSFSQNKLLAEIFLTEFVATLETMAELYARDPRPPAYLPLLATIDDVDVLGVRESAADGIPMPSIPEMSAVWTAWSDAIENVANGALTPEAALNDAVAIIRATIEASR